MQPSIQQVLRTLSYINFRNINYSFGYVCIQPKYFSHIISVVYCDHLFPYYKIYSKIFAIPIVNGFTPWIHYCCFNSQKYSPYTFSFTCQPTKCCHYKKKSSWQVEATTGQFFRKCRLFYLNKFISLFYCIIKGRRLLQRIHTT